MAPHSPAVKLHSRAGTPSSAAPAMGAHRWSHPIAKGPPRKIRIVHVLAPEVIKTDVRHFRELVQRLTGKPKPNGDGVGGGSSFSSSSWSAESAAAVESSYQQAAAGGSSFDAAVQTVAPAAAVTVKAEVKKEEEVAASPEEGLGEAEGRNDAFFQDLDEFLLGADHFCL